MPKTLLPIKRVVDRIRSVRRGRGFAKSLTPAPVVPESLGGVLIERFRGHIAGPGIWKWEHYLPIYERHLSVFVGRAPVVLEIGIYSGGSLPLWKGYFGDGCHLIGVDINPACLAYESEGVTVYIGDQESRSFWRSLSLPPLDIVIDDGGHFAGQQIVALEKLLPRMAPKSVYICEDVHGLDNPFASYVHGLTDALNSAAWTDGDAALNIKASPFQRSVSSIHHYPFLTVIEKSPGHDFRAPKQGTSWEPPKWVP